MAVLDKEQIDKYPSTRFMGSKQKILNELRCLISKFDCSKVLDLFSGSGIVSYMLKTEGKQVISNDYMSMCSIFSKALIENNNVTLDHSKAVKLINKNSKSDRFVETNFKGLYFSDEENILIDNIRSNIKKLKDEYEQAIALMALIRACMKKRPRGIFTYVGYRYDDGRLDLKKSFEEQFFDAINQINEAVFDNGKKCQSLNLDALKCNHKPDLVYMDPPYYSPYSDNEYVRRYHFVEGIARNWEGVDIQWETKTKKIKNYPTPFSTKKGAHNAFDKLIKKFQDSVIVVSYSSNSLPTLEDMTRIISKYKPQVDVISIDYKYSFANQGHRNGDIKNSVEEYLFVGY